MAGEGCVREAGVGLSGYSTILGGFRPQDHLETLWRAESCPALSREQRIKMIAEAGRWMALQ